MFRTLFVDGKCVMNLSQMKESVIIVTINDIYNTGMAVHIWDLSAGEAEIEASLGFLGQPS